MAHNPPRERKNQISLVYRNTVEQATSFEPAKARVRPIFHDRIHVTSSIVFEAAPVWSVEQNFPYDLGKYDLISQKKSATFYI